MSPIFEHVLKL